jgi:hypothetical protein
VYTCLYRIVRKKDEIVANFLLNVSFRRGLVNKNINSWYDLVSKVVQVNLIMGKDKSRWNMTKNSLFTVQSMYRTMIRQGVLPKKTNMKIKGTLKIKNFFGS